MSTHLSGPAPTLRGRWLLLARVAWIAVTVATLGNFVAAIPARYAQLAHPAEAVRTALAAIGLSAGTYAFYNVALDTLFVAVFATTGIIIFLRRSDDAVALLAATMLVVWGALNGLFVLTPRAIEGMYPPALAVLLVVILPYIGYMAWMLFFYLFPSGHFVPRWTRWLALCWVLFSGSWLFTTFGPPSWPPLLFNAAILILWGSFVVAQVYRYVRVSNAGQRQQTKWVVFGVAVAVVGVMATVFTVGAAVDLRPEEVSRRMLSMLLMDTFMLSIPISIGIAVLRSRLFDIDIVINRTLVYGSLTATLVVLYFGAIVVLQRIFVILTGERSTLAVVASTQVIAALFNPLRRRVQAFVDRRFYRRKYDARNTLEVFSAKLKDETDLAALSNDLVAVVRETMQPAHVSLWLQPDPPPRGRLEQTQS
ncbi:MAG: hypothetical protein M3328_00445 [Chloroflexota bacterium]|nr:hypothetical protein [Chloroflexota bacterium]